MELPQQPDPNLFVDEDDQLRALAYSNALTAWERVCLAIIAAERTSPLPVAAGGETRE